MLHYSAINKTAVTYFEMSIKRNMALPAFPLLYEVMSSFSSRDKSKTSDNGRLKPL